MFIDLRQRRLARRKPRLGSRLDLSHPAVVGLQAFWAFNEGTGRADDLVYEGGGNRLTPQTEAAWVTGRMGGPAVNFPGTSNKYFISPGPPTHAVNNWAFDFVVTLSSLNQRGEIFYNGATGNGWGATITDSSAGGASTGARLRIEYSGVFLVNTGYDFANANTPYHVLASRIAGTLFVFVNGALVSNTDTHTPGAPVTFLSVGDGPLDPFNGTVEYLRVWNRAILPAEVPGLYVSPFEMCYEGGARWMYRGPVVAANFPALKAAMARQETHWSQYEE